MSQGNMRALLSASGCRPRQNPPFRGAARTGGPGAIAGRARQIGALIAEVLLSQVFGVSMGVVLARINVIALNTYREAVRARVLHGLFGLAIATGGYSLVAGSYTARDQERVVSDLGAASVSIYGIVVAVVLGASSLYQELQLKTLFPILARPLRRWEYLVGKYLGTLLTLFVFIAMNSGALLLALASLGGQPLWATCGGALGLVLVALGIGWRLPRLRVYLPIGLGVAWCLLGFVLAEATLDDRRVVMSSAALTLLEVGIVAAIATVFASFSSPFLTAVFTFSVFIVGRSADALAQLPERIFGASVARAGEIISQLLPNLMFYVPPRSLLTGQAATGTLSEHLLLASGHAVAWVVFLLAGAAIIFQRRDFL